MNLPLWLATVFPWDISKTYFDESTQDNPVRCLMDRPEVTMRHPIIDFDVKATCNMVLETAKIPPSSDHMKPLLAVVKGRGSGKTRCLEEMRRELLRRPAVLAFGVTFNAVQKIDYDELEWGSNNHQIAFALMVIARCSSALFDINLRKMRNIITEMLPELDTIGVKNIGCSLLKEYFRFVVDKVRSQGKVVNDVVVIIDDIMKVQDVLEKYCKDTVGDVCSSLNEAMLNLQVIPFTFNSTLCMSSSTISAIKTTMSERPVISLHIPSELNTTCIIKEWWKCSEEDESRLLYVAACIHSLPKAVEIVQIFLTMYSNRTKDSSFMNDLFKDLHDKLSFGYIWYTFPHDDIIFSILFAKKIESDSYVQGLIAYSILLNSMETSSPKLANMVPISSFTVLAGCRLQEGNELQRETIQLYTDMLQDIVYMAGNNSNERILYKSFFANWMKYRWKVAKISLPIVRVQEFLGIKKIFIKKTLFKNKRNVKNVNKLLNTIVSWSYPTSLDFSYLNINSMQDPMSHLKEVKRIKVNSFYPITVRKGAMNDAFDLLFVIYQGIGLKPLLFYIKYPSLSTDNRNMSADMYKPTKRMYQYRRIKSMCTAGNVPFVFCYWTYNPGSFSMIENDFFVLREKETKAFFGPIWPIFIALRSSLHTSFW